VWFELTGIMIELSIKLLYAITFISRLMHSNTQNLEVKIYVV